MVWYWTVAITLPMLYMALLCTMHICLRGTGSYTRSVSFSGDPSSLWAKCSISAMSDMARYVSALACLNVWSIIDAKFWFCSLVTWLEQDNFFQMDFSLLMSLSFLGDACRHTFIILYNYQYLATSSVFLDNVSYLDISLFRLTINACLGNWKDAFALSTGTGLVKDKKIVVGAFITGEPELGVSSYGFFWWIWWARECWRLLKNGSLLIWFFEIISLFWYHFDNSWCIW